MQMTKSPLSAFQVIVNSESLVIFFESTQFPQKRQILLGVLANGDDRSTIQRRRGGEPACHAYFLGVLGDHEHQLKVVHPQSHIV